MQPREQAIEQLARSPGGFDMLIVGGGATGLGAAVDAAARGYRVALVERADFASGTSSRSTKLVHGGVRYLRQGDIGLVRSALRERTHLARNAPHLVHRMAFVIPVYGRVERLYYRFGLEIYERLAGRWSLGRSRSLSAEETAALIPTVERRGLRGGVLYYDGQFDDARLSIALAQTASGKGAVLANYVSCDGLVKEEGRIVGARLRDQETGREFEVRARAVINATGVFADSLRRSDDPAVPRLLSASQGVHVVLPRRFLPGVTALMVPRTRDGRVLFAIPWQGCVIVGTTDTPGVEPALEPAAREDEIDFILEHARLYLAHAPSRRDILSVFAGLRPLVGRTNRKTSVLSRDHTLEVSGSGLVTITGGKWTTYRKMAEDTVDGVERLLGWPHRPSVTADLPLHGATTDLGMRPGLRRYGSEAEAIEGLIRENPDWQHPVADGVSLLRAEVIWQARQEMARTVADVLARRARVLTQDARAARAAAPEVARLLAHVLGRDAGWAQSEVNRFLADSSAWLPPTLERPCSNPVPAPLTPLPEVPPAILSP
jgi:glycerol-3-phosphate dehydrogenase